jgi:uncharacterized protein YndB with AHSA1/START domain
MTEEPSRQAAEQHVTVTRVFDAPRDVVFRAWTDPDQVAEWWGPESVHTPREFIEIDLRVGGRFHLAMVRGESGARFPLEYEIVELEPPALLVLRHEAMPEMGQPVPTTTRVELQEDGDRTRVTVTDGPFLASAPAEAGWIGALAKLERLLTTA